MRLGQPAPTLSGGEAQRVKLASELQKRSTGRTVYVLDEPTTGLHFADVEKLLGVINGLVDKGNTVIVIEHNLDVIKTADHVIDMGPEGGSGGGLVIAEGTPEEIAAHPDSYTGQFLARMLAGRAALSTRAAGAAGRRGAAPMRGGQWWFGRLRRGRLPASRRRRQDGPRERTVGRTGRDGATANGGRGERHRRGRANGGEPRCGQGTQGCRRRRTGAAERRRRPPERGGRRPS